MSGHGCCNVSTTTPYCLVIFNAIISAPVYCTVTLMSGVLCVAVFVITRVAGVRSSPVDPWLTNFICAMRPQNICICISPPLYLCLVADIFVKGGKAPAPWIICRLPVNINISGTKPGMINWVGKQFKIIWQRSEVTTNTRYRVLKYRRKGERNCQPQVSTARWPLKGFHLLYPGTFQV